MAKKKLLTFEELTKGIGTFEDVCKKRGDKPADILAHKIAKTIRQQINNDNAMLDYIAEYLKQGQTDCIYYPVFFNNSSGFGFSTSFYGFWSTYANCGSRLWMPDHQTTKFFGTQFLEIHKRLLTNKYKTKK